MQPTGVEAFAEGVFPGSPDWGRRCPGGLGSGSRIGQHAALGISELDAIVDVGVAEPPLVVEPVVSRAEADEIPGVGWTVRRPMDDVMQVQAP